MILGSRRTVTEDYLGLGVQRGICDMRMSHSMCHGACHTGGGILQSGHVARGKHSRTKDYRYAICTAGVKRLLAGYGHVYWKSSWGGGTCCTEQDVEWTHGRDEVALHMSPRNGKCKQIW